jgi:hypothetical protein
MESVDRLNPLTVGHLDIDRGRLKVRVLQQVRGRRSSGPRFSFRRDVTTSCRQLDVYWSIGSEDTCPSGDTIFTTLGRIW